MIAEYKEERHDFGNNACGPTPPAGIMWVFIEDGQAVSVDFQCPCGCGHSCYTPLRGNHPQRWDYSQGPNGPTLSPSIRYVGGCKAHFTITDGKVTMHGDSGK